MRVNGAVVLPTRVKGYIGSGIQAGTSFTAT